MQKPNLFKRSIANKLIVYILLFSSLITLVMTSIQLYFDYSKELEIIETRMRQIEQSYLQSIINSLWVTNIKQLNLQLEGILRLPDMQYLSIEHNQEAITSVGTPQENYIISRQFPLSYTYRNQKIELGTLTAVVNLRGIYQRLIEKVLVILGTQAVKTFLVSGFIFFLVYYLISRHLATMAQHTETLDLESGQMAPLALNRPPMREEKTDELEQLLTSFNTMQVKLSESFDQLRISNVTLHREIEQRQQIEEELRKNEQQFRELFENVPISLWEEDFSAVKKYIDDLKRQGVCDFDAYFSENPQAVSHCASLVKILRFNKTSLEMFQAPEGTLDEGLQQTFDEQSLEVFQKELVTLAQGQNQFNSEAVVYSLKGQKLYINLRVFIAPDYQESWSKVLVSIDNISEYKQEEEKRLKLEMHLQQKQKMEAIGTLAGGVAHDFNNLLFAMLGNVTMALKNLPPDSKIEENLQDSLIAIRRAKALVLQILAFSRQQNTERVPLEIGPVVKESLKMMRSTLPSTIDIQQDIEAEQPPILADPTQIHQIVVNLCTNAGYMMQEQGGTLGVKLETIQPDETLKTLHGLSEDCYLKLTVSDTGAGIPPEIQERVFEPFFTTKPMGEGTGMGLAVVHGIMSNHEGGVTVFSEPGKGARFEVFFPAIETEDVAEEVFDFGPEGIQKGKILVVDDEPALVRVEQQILINFGYDVIVSTSSVEALELFRSQPDQFDMLITDHEMPEMPGLQLAEEILQLRPDLPVLLVVGSERLISREQTLAKGVHAYLIKPVEADHFGNIVQRALV